MKKNLLFLFLTTTFSVNCQSVIQSVNSGSILAPNSTVSIGEIIVIPENANQSTSGIIGILAQVNQQNLEVPELALNDKIVVYPNPTMNSITFQTENSLENKKVSIVNLSGQIVAKKLISSSNSLDLSELKTGVYLIQFENKNINSFKIIKK